MHPTEFTASFHQELEKLFLWRRDVRHFRTEPLPEELLDKLLNYAWMAPSVGLSEPWRFMRVDTPKYKHAIYEEFKRCNQEARNRYTSEKAEHYAKLKLAGLDDAPHHIAVFSEQNPEQGHGVGRQTMPETTLYSTVMAIFSFWLAARSYGVGVGWVSILDPQKVCAILETPKNWKFVAYLCVGYPKTLDDTPELERLGWEKRNLTHKKWFRI
ncbi:MAG: 5,6-dimethylbenzimidazole synthase [Commensalibacter sp.]